MLGTPRKVEPNCSQFTVGGNRINYPGKVATPIADMLVAKILFNSVISTRGAQFMMIDISNFYLMTLLKRPEYIRVKIDDLSKEIINKYKLYAMVNKSGMVYIEVTKGMYGLPQAGLLANELLKQQLNEHGYFQSKLVPGLWKHITRPISFTLVVNNFGVKYVGKEHIDHLMTVFQEHYQVKANGTGNRYIGIYMAWDYNKGQGHLYMPGYVQKALKLFEHIHKKTQNQPFPTHINKIRSQKNTQQESTAPPVNPTEKKFIQKVCGKFLLYRQVVDSTVLTPISAIASQSANPTKKTLTHTNQLLNYFATQEDAVLTYNRSEMITAVHSGASYLCEPNAKSPAGGHFFMSNNAKTPPNNGTILNIAHIIKHIMMLATEAKLGAL